VWVSQAASANFSRSSGPPYRSERPTVSARRRALHFEVLLGYQRSPPARCVKRMSNVWTHLQMKSILRSGGDNDLGVSWIKSVVPGPLMRFHRGFWVLKHPR